MSRFHHELKGLLEDVSGRPGRPGQPGMGPAGFLEFQSRPATAGAPPQIEFSVTGMPVTDSRSASYDGVITDDDHHRVSFMFTRL
jgi:hypothetical protein